MNRIAKCPVCKHTDFAFVFAAIDGFVSGESFDVLECHHCGLRITQPVPDEKEMPRFYDAGDYAPHSGLSSGTFEKTYGLVRKVMLGRKRKLIERDMALKPGRLLDMGCGEGAFLNEMRHAGWNVEGVDSSSRARELAQNNYGLTVHDPGEWLNTGKPEYDLVTFWHALEHVHRLDEILSVIRHSVKNGGWVIIAVPNYESYDARHYRHLWAAYDVPRHLYHFNYSSMATLLDEHGFHLVDVRSLPFDSFYVSLLSEKKGNGNFVRGLWVGFRSYLNTLSDTLTSSSLVFLSSTSAHV